MMHPAAGSSDQQGPVATEFTYSRSGNVISKAARVQGAQFVVNQGSSFIGPNVEVHAERNNGKPIISWGRHVILDAGAHLWPAERNGTYYPLILGAHVYVGPRTRVEAASIGSHVAIGQNCSIGRFAIVKDCVIVPPDTIIPPFAVVGPLTNGATGAELPESAQEVIDFYCEQLYNGVRAPFPEFDE